MTWRTQIMFAPALVIVLSACGGAGHPKGSGEAPYAAALTVPCLRQQKVAVDANHKKWPVPAQAVYTHVLELSFPAIAGRPANTAALFFEKDPSNARRLMRTIEAQKASIVRHAPADEQARLRRLLKRSSYVLGNVIVLWANFEGPGARQRQVSDCLLPSQTPA